MAGSPAGLKRVCRAPGRVNLIGEHTDYNQGFVLPVALELACFTSWTPHRWLRVYSENLQETREWEIRELETARPAGDWGDYVAGVAREILRAGFDLEPKDLVVRSTVPLGSGLSSSASLEVSVALALLGDQAIQPLDLVQLCHRAETQFVGLPCGVMDQYVSVFGRAGAALEIDCRSLEHRPVALPPGVEVVAINTMVKHALGESAYRERVAECAAAAEAMGVSSLRDVSADQLSLLSGTLLKRARHVITENERVHAFVTACEREDLEEMGRLFVASHRSLQHDYEVSCEELDFLVDAALAVPGVLGARMTGGGFGGCTVNLVRSGASAELSTQRFASAYRARFGVDPQVYLCQASAAAGEM